MEAPMERTRPPSLEEICQEADRFEFNKNVPFKHWLRAAEALWFQVRYKRPGFLRCSFS
jgi:STAM-binding protein